jgi:hypothetical protein
MPHDRGAKALQARGRLLDQRHHVGAQRCGPVPVAPGVGEGERVGVGGAGQRNRDGGRIDAVGTDEHAERQVKVRGRARQRTDHLEPPLQADRVGRP